MFKFLKRRQVSAILADSENEAQRSAKAEPQFLSGPRDVHTRADLLRRAAAAGVAEHETVKRLEFLHRLLDAVTVDPTPAPAMLDGLLVEATRYQFDNISAARTIRQHRRLQRLAEDGPQAVGRNEQGRAIYFQGTVEFKNKEGRLEVRDDGVTFVGEVVLEIPWSNVAHAAKTTHTYQGMDYSAVARQESKRRTPTKFAFTDFADADYGRELTMRVWEQHKPRQ